MNYTKIAKVNIGDRVFIGAAAIILPGVKIGNDVIVGAGSVVTKDIPEGVVVAGNPAKVICTLSSYLEKRNSELKKYPRFGDEYTLRKNVTAAMKSEMNKKMKERIGYIV